MPAELDPAALRHRRGRRPLLFVAPHGGRRDPVRYPWTAGRIRVNDLHTAALTLDLAERLDASALVNWDIDRNDLDLNRLSRVAGRAPWFLDALADHLEHLIAAHGRAVVLVVHGWNIANPICDLGIGVRPADAGLQPPALPAGAMDGALLEQVVLPMRAACGRRAIGTVFGWRYPASHPENLIQLFTGRHSANAHPAMARIAALAGRASAVQLELSIPLRWPGAWRHRFIEACTEVFGETGDTTHPAADTTHPTAADAAVDGGTRTTTADPPLPIRRLAVQFHDPATLFAGLIAIDEGAAGTATRVLLLPPDGGLYLHTGESPSAGTAATARPALDVAVDTQGRLHLRFTGPLLRFPDMNPFLDLETGLGRAALYDAELALDLEPAEPAADLTIGGFASASGRVGISLGNLRTSSDAPSTDSRFLGMSLGDTRSGALSRASLGDGGYMPGDAAHWTIAGPAWVDNRPPLRARSRFTATVHGWRDRPLRIVMVKDVAAVISDHPTDERLQVEDVRCPATAHDDGPLVAVIAVRAAGGRRMRLDATAIHRIPVIRQVRGAAVARHVLAFCRFDVDDEPAGHGWLEAAL